MQRQHLSGSDLGVNCDCYDNTQRCPKGQMEDDQSPGMEDRHHRTHQSRLWRLRWKTYSALLFCLAFLWMLLLSSLELASVLAWASVFLRY